MQRRCLPNFSSREDHIKSDLDQRRKEGRLRGFGTDKGEGLKSPKKLADIIYIWSLLWWGSDTTWKSSMDLQHWGKLAKHMHRVHHSTCFYVNVSTLEWLDQSQWYFTWWKYGPATAHSTNVKKLKQSSQRVCYHGNVYHYYAYNLRRKLKSYHGSLLRYGKPDLQFLGTLKNN